MGFLLLDCLTHRHSLSWTKPAGTYRLSEFELEDNHVFLLKPLTYMNLSGRSVEAFSLHHPFDTSELLVLCDDFALPLGRVRLRRRGSDGGHNGLRSIMEALGTQEFPRLRMGVGPVPEEATPTDFVLEPFADEERTIADNTVRRAADCFELLVRSGFNAAMGTYNAPLPGEDAGTKNGSETD
jgi:PTH1 family peptidyl-tRNA hydrolase